MEHNEVALHVHDYGITFDTFNKSRFLADEMVITAYDEQDSQKFVASMEHKKYAIYAIMYHPEYLVSPAIKIPLFQRTPLFNKLTSEIGFRITLAFNHLARQNSFRWGLGEEKWLQYQVDRVPLTTVPGLGGQYVYKK